MKSLKLREVNNKNNNRKYLYKIYDGPGAKHFLIYYLYITHITFNLHNNSMNQVLVSDPFSIWETDIQKG